MAWRFETAGPDGQCKLFGVNIFNCDWRDCRETAAVVDPHYGAKKLFHVFEVEVEEQIRRFAAGEFSKRRNSMGRAPAD
jgi:hypothetical protein